jgi:hypothetical protein
MATASHAAGFQLRQTVSMMQVVGNAVLVRIYVAGKRRARTKEES